jgi:hypothetical protein
MSYREYGKWLAIGLFGFMGLSWDAFFFVGIIMGNGAVTIHEQNLAVAWIEFTLLAVLSVFVLIVILKHIAHAAKKRI